MDNGLIFPYRQSSAHGEPSNAKRLKLTAEVFGSHWWVERVTRAGSSQAMGRHRKVASAWRWLSTSKGVGSEIGKSVSHIS